MYHRKQKTQQKNFRSIQIFFTGFIIDDDYPDQDQELDKHHHQDLDLDQDHSDLDLDQDHSDLDPDLYPEIGSAVFRIRFIDDRFAKTKN
jgi:hypothetical protein